MSPAASSEQTPRPSPDNTPEGMYGSLIALLQNQYEQSHTAYEELRELETRALTGDTHARALLDEQLDDLAHEVASEIDEFQGNRILLLGLSEREDREEEARKITKRQREIVGQARELIAGEAGLQEEAAVSELETARKRVQERIDVAVKAGRVTKPEDALVELGIIVKDEDGSAHFEWPEDTFPESVNQKWQVYLEAVVNHLREGQRLRDGIGSKDDVVHADEVRRLAHNTASSDVAKVLGLDRLGQDWTLERTRSLLAKMREAQFPNIQTSEEAETARAITDGLAIRALSALVRKKGTSHKQ